MNKISKSCRFCKNTRIKWSVSPFLVAMIVILIALGYVYDCIIYFTTIILHELAHAEVSVRLGYTLDKFILMPYGAALKGEFDGVRTKDEIVIALAGPAFNCVLSVVCVALWWLAPSSYAFTQRLVFANVFTAAFNLLPVFPLDGGRIALAAASIKLPRQKAYKRLRVFGFVAAPVFAVLFALIAIFNKTLNVSFALISVFIFVSSVFPDKNSTYRRVYEAAYFSERLKRGLKIIRILVSQDATLLQLDKMLNGNYYTEFAIADQNLNVVSVISETELEQLLKTNDACSTVGDAVKRKVRK